MLFHQSTAEAMNKHYIVTHFTMNIIYLYLTCNNILFVKKYLSLLWVFTNFSILIAFWTHCDNAATNSNSENAKSRMVASLQGSVGTGTKEDESSVGLLDFTTLRPILAWMFWNLWTIYFFNFPNFFQAEVNCGYGVPPVFVVSSSVMTLM